MLIASTVLLAASLAAMLAGWPAAIRPALISGVLVLVLLIERYIYKPIVTVSPGTGWDKTAERFVDPRSGRSVAVYFNPTTGQRRYVAEAPDDTKERSALT